MSKPLKYRKKPVTIEAMLFDGSNGEMHAVYKWVEANTQGSYDYTGDERPEHGVSIDPTDGAFVIHTLEGEMRVSKGDYVIRGVQGEFYPIKEAIFLETYEPVEEAVVELTPSSLQAEIDRLNALSKAVSSDEQLHQ